VRIISKFIISCVIGGVVDVMYSSVARVPSNLMRFFL